MPRSYRAALIPALLLATPAAAQTAAQSAGDAPARAEEVSIPFATHGGIYNFVADRSGEGLYLEDVHHKWYYASLAPRCFNLDYAFRIGFRTWAGTSSLSRGDTIYADGESCRIMSLTRSAPPPDKPKKPKKARPTA